MKDLERQIKGNVGLFLVCAELSKMGLIAMPTSRNTKGYDIVVLNPDTNVGMNIQVKCTDSPQKGFPVLTSYWKDYKEKIQTDIIADFIFVDISKLDKPKYFIVPKEELKYIVKLRVEEYIKKYQKKHLLTWMQMLHKEEKTKRQKDLWVIKMSDISEYINWNVIIDSLRKFKRP